MSTNSIHTKICIRHWHHMALLHTLSLYSCPSDLKREKLFYQNDVHTHSKTIISVRKFELIS